MRTEITIARTDLIPPLPTAQSRLTQTHPPRHTPSPDDTSHGAEASTKGVHTRVLEMCDFLLLALRLNGLARGLHENGGAPAETLELGRVDFGHLEEGDTEADGDEAEDHGD